MAAGKRANGSFLQLQGLEGSDLPSTNRLYTVVNSYVRKSRVFCIVCLLLVRISVKGNVIPTGSVLDLKQVAGLTRRPYLRESAYRGSTVLYF